MDNFLDNGAVLPSGLLGSNVEAMVAGFNKSYRNTSLRLGIIIRGYPVSDVNNLTKLTNEYDVLVFEQNEDRGSSLMTYPHCIASEGLGSIADFLEMTLRIRKNSPSMNSFIDTKGQNGAVVLLQCIDGMSDKAIIIGAVTHPDRKTTLTSTEPYLQGEYNGVNVTINTDGSVVFTFKGATDNDGKAVDKSQGNTVVQVEKDGSFQINHSTITFRLDRNGTATLTTSKDLDINANGNVNVVTKGNLNATVSGDAKATISGDFDATVSGDCNAAITGKLVATASEIDLNGATGKVLTTATDPVVDTIFGAPTQGVSTVKAG